jgi:RNA polymerase subunit RPABC4/transcription elongation factor Spt4
MAGKGCPHCGNVLPEDTASCSCGFAFSSGDFEVQGAGVARSLLDRTLGMTRKAPSKRAERARNPAAAKGAKDEKMVKTKPVGSAPAQADPSRLMDCPFCSARISKRANACPKCGRKPFLDCRICGSNILAGTAVCPECGDPDPFNP